MKSLFRKSVIVVLLACTAALVFAVPGIAASRHSISGTCRDDAQWYISGLDRKVLESNTTIRAAFYDQCVKSMYFKLINANTGGQLGSTIVASGDAQTLATGVRAGTYFNNAFRLSSSVISWQDRNFAGYEWY